MNNRLTTSNDLIVWPFVAPIVGIILGVLMLFYGDQLGRVVPRGALDGYSSHLIACLVGAPILITLYLWKKGTALPALLAISSSISLFCFTLLPATSNGSVTVIEQLICLLGAIILAWSLVRFAPFHSPAKKMMVLIRRLGHVPSLVYVGTLFMLFLALTITLSWELFMFRPSYDDSLVQYIQGKIYAQGEFFIKHPLQEFFQTKLMINTKEQWYSIWQPLHAFFISLGFRVGAPWIANPMLGGLTLVAIYFLARRVAGEKTARLAALLTLFCPFIFFMSSEYMVHATSLLFSALFLLFFFEMRHAIEFKNQTDAACFALLVGLSIGMVFLIRPLTGVGVMLLFVVFFLYELWKKPKDHLPSMLAIGLGFAVCGCIQIWYNLNTTTDWWLAPYVKDHERGLPGFERGHTILIGLLKGQREWGLLNHAMFEWFVPSTIFVLLACLTPMKNTALKLLALLLVVYSIVNMYNRFIYHIFGPRFIYELTPAIIVLTAYGMMKLPALIRCWGIRLPAGKSSTQASLIITVMVIFASGWSDKIPMVMGMYKRYIHNKPQFVETILEGTEKPALVFIERPRNKFGTRRREGPNKYLWVAFLNPPTPDAPVIVARDLGDTRNKELMAYYPKHKPYLEYKGRLFEVDPETKTSDEARSRQRRDFRREREKRRPGIDIPVKPAEQSLPKIEGTTLPAQ
jgi:hypothetical protein